MKFKVIKKSSFYETPSYPNKKNPKFINVIIEGFNIYPPLIDLASVLIFIEEKLRKKKRIKKMIQEHVILILLIIMVKLLILNTKT